MCLCVMSELTLLCLSTQGADRRKGNTTRSYQYETRFSPPKDCDIFVPFTRVRASAPSSSSSSSVLQPHPGPPPEPEQLQVGDRVTYFSDTCCHGMVLAMEEEAGKCFVLISTVSHI